jgi:hypothetical protein
LPFFIAPSVFSKDTKDTGQINVREYRRGNKKDNPEKLAI